MQYEDYKTIHEKIKNICEFINDNSYIKLKEEVTTLKNKIIKLDIKNWNDYNYELFEKERINNLNIINLVTDSIDTLYKYSEIVYKQLLIALNNLEVGSKITIVDPKDSTKTYELEVTGIYKENTDSSSNMASMFTNSANEIITNISFVEKILLIDK